MSIERLRGRNGHRINYRHIIWSLVRKPGAFGQTPDEIYFGRGDEVPDQLAEAKRLARQARLETKRKPQL